MPAAVGRDRQGFGALPDRTPLDSGGVGYCIEYTGEAIRRLSMERG